MHGRRHDFGTGGAELKVGRKTLCARLRAQIFDHTHQYVTHAHLYRIYIYNCYNIECCCYLGLPQLWYVITRIDNYDVDL